MQDNHFAQRLDIALTQAGVPRGRARTARVAAIFEVSRETSRLWIKGRMPGMSMLQRMAKSLRVPLEWLATGHGQPNHMKVSETAGTYPADSIEQQLIGIIRIMTPKRRRALLTVLSTD